MSRRGNKKGVNWNVERRCEFIEFRLYWQGNKNRSDMMEAFGISVQQVFKDLTNYIEGRKSNPELSESQRKVIALDYGMRVGKAQIKVRRALLYYVLKRLGLDTDPTARRPQDQQIVLLNAAEFGVTTNAPIAPKSARVSEA